MKNFVRHFSRAFLFLLILFLTFSANAQTYISGFISANYNWTIAGSPYIITGNTLLSLGFTLKIDSGVEVKFNSGKTLQIDGELLAEGTSQNRIKITSNQIIPTAGDWGEIYFSNISTKAVFDNKGNYLSGSIMRYCDVSYGGNGLGSIHIESSAPYFNHCSIRNSNSDGIYCHGSSYLIDSSTVDHCKGYGLSFYRIMTTSCGLTIVSDSIQNNTKGGIYIEDNPGCTTVIKGNYFSLNINRGAIYASIVNSYEMDNFKILENYFVSNSALYDAVVYIMWANGALISGNYFNGNSAGSASSGILSFGTNSGRGNNDTVECNLFLSNQTGGYGAIYLPYTGDAVIRNNNFEGNTSSYGVVVTSHHGSTVTGSGIHFTNNTIKNNTCLSGSCCKFEPDLYTNTPHMHIEHNNFINNNVMNTIHLTGNNISNTSNNFLYMKNNNFLNPNSQYELYNNIPSGSPGVHADSNYWGSSSAQHIDSVIYDFFDNSAKSVVYYKEYLGALVVIDTTCTFTIPTNIKEENNDEGNSHPFPNPFSTSTTITFKELLKDATLVMYNVFGQKVKAMEHINANSIHIERENLVSGIYIYEVVEKHRPIANGKLVIE